MGVGIPPPPPPLYVRGLKVCKTILSLMTINFLLLRKYASPLSFCYRWSLLPKCALSNRNRSKSGTNLEKCHICQLIYWPRDLPASFFPKYTPQDLHFCSIFVPSKFVQIHFIVQCRPVPKQQLLPVQTTLPTIIDNSLDYKLDSIQNCCLRFSLLHTEPCLMSSSPQCFSPQKSGCVADKWGLGDMLEF